MVETTDRTAELAVPAVRSSKIVVRKDEEMETLTAPKFVISFRTNSDARTETLYDYLIEKWLAKTVIEKQTVVVRKGPSQREMLIELDQMMDGFQSDETIMICIERPGSIAGINLPVDVEDL